MPAPQQSCSSARLYVIKKKMTLDFPSHCPTNPPSSGGGGTNTGQKQANMLTYLGTLISGNENHKNDFEVQATISSKIGQFLTDSLLEPEVAVDSVLTLLASNASEMSDSDLMEVFS